MTQNRILNKQVKRVDSESRVGKLQTPDSYNSFNLCATIIVCILTTLTNDFEIGVIRIIQIQRYCAT